MSDIGEEIGAGDWINVYIGYSCLSDQFDQIIGERILMIDDPYVQVRLTHGAQMIKQCRQMYNRDDSIALMNQCGSRREAFFFMISYDGDKNIVVPLASNQGREIAGIEGIAFSLPLLQHKFNARQEPAPDLPSNPYFNPIPIARERYEESFAVVQRHLLRGDTYLLNLCFPTSVETNLELEHFFDRSHAPYKVMLKGKEFHLNGEDDEYAMVCFSPEAFVRIREGIIATFPMKGTADADQPGAKETLLADEKESREHATIVDLMRNDLSMVSTNVRVERYRYVERLETATGGILQCSSEIAGDLPEGWRDSLGDLLMRLLPAGSVTGAPKLSTCRAIHEAEIAPRGYYTGIFGYFDGVNLDSAVAIRYLERTHKGLVYKSGGGITVMSQSKDEYDELVRKVYVPFSL